MFAAVISASWPMSLLRRIRVTSATFEAVSSAEKRQKLFRKALAGDP
jgi:hypothetical protein